MSGSYTVGQPGDDFLTIYGAIDTLKTEGMSGPVHFLLSDGFYGSLVISSFNPVNNDTLTIRSHSGNQDSVTFSRGQIINSKNIIIKDIGFYKQYSSGNSLVYIDEGINIRFSGCRIVDDKTTNYNADEATFKIDHAWTGQITSVYIDSCYISGLNGKPPYIINEHTINESGDNGRTYFTKDTIIGGWYIFNAYYRYFNGCLLTLDKLDYVGNRVFYECKLDFYPLNNSYPRLKANHIDNCEIFGVYELDLESLKIEYSIFHLPVKMVHTQYFLF